MYLQELKALLNDAGMLVVSVVGLGVVSIISLVLKAYNKILGKNRIVVSTETIETKASKKTPKSL